MGASFQEELEVVMYNVAFEDSMKESLAITNEELFTRLFTSAFKFECAFLNRNAAKKQFLKGYNTIQKVHFNELQDIQMYLEECIYNMKEKGPSFWDVLRDYEYEIFAYELALDCCYSIVKRFITGGEGEGHLLLNR